MCNKGIGCLIQSQDPVDPRQNYQAVYLMDSPVSTTSTPGIGSGTGKDMPRMKFLCSFLGNIMPRPQDGKLRYVGGETRIVSLPRDISYMELMQRMRELYEEAAVLKYQQPDEDLDALVSVVNDDDVTNMMEEYEKLGSGDGFTRLRIFLFSHPDHDGSSHYVDGDDTERRYVDALNNMNDASDYMSLPQPDFPGMCPIDDLHATEQFVSMHNLNFNPLMESSQLQQLASQRYGEMESPWSPEYYSPRHHGHLDPRSLSDFPSSPSGRFHMPFGDLQDKMPEEYARQHLSHQAIPTYEHQPHFPDNAVWLPPGAIIGDKSGFPGNILHNSNAFEGNNISEHCRVSYPRNQSHLEQPNIDNGLPLFANSCNECRPHRESFMPNADNIYPKEQNDPRAVYNEAPNHERAWLLQHQLNPRVEESRVHVSGSGRLNDHYIVDGQGMNFPPGQGNIMDAHQMPSNYVHHRAGPELGTEVYHDQVMSAAPHMHIPPEERGVRYGNVPYAYGTENPYHASHRHVPGHVVWRNFQSPVHGSPSYGTAPAPQQLNGAGSPRFFIGEDSQSTLNESPQKIMGFDVETTPEYSYGSKVNPNTVTQDIQNPYSPDSLQSQHDRIDIATTIAPVELPDSSSTITHDKLVSAATLGHNPESVNCTNVTEAANIETKNSIGGQIEKHHEDNAGIPTLQIIPYPDNEITITDKRDGVASHGSVSSPTSVEGKGNMVKPGEMDLHAPMGGSKQTVYNLIPELGASMKKVALEGSEEVKTAGEGTKSVEKETTANELESMQNANGDVVVDSENDHLDTSKIEPTKAEAEAIARGLQTIRNDDLEEIRELGSGTYGAVYHGKWRGSDVAIKRIKASCFAGRPSDRERLIADFWKEALMLSSLHHPNVVSFYGIVRDGPDGSLATVTEFMVNGSLKQFLQKKDRTIDRRKRLIIAMDAAFGMEYLHGKNVVHFDLKCENLLVNMRDSQRPVCKIGDLGLSKVKQKTLVSGGVRGTLPWMAPELLSGKSSMVTEKIDVYSFAIVMWELLTGDEPYADMHCASIIGGIVNNTLRPQIPTWCDPEWKTLMQRSWASDPADRPSFSEISQKLRTMAAAIKLK